MATGRFVPSPTGDLHVGNLRTGLLAWLFARSTGSAFRLRVDDIDPVASRAEHERRQLSDLAAIGIDWDGDVVHATERRSQHDAAVAQLEAQGLTYPCYCTRKEIREASAAPHGGLPDAYPGTCRDLSDTERRARAAAGRPAATRLRSEHVAVTIVDRLHGEVVGVVDDVVLRRNDGVPAYNLAVVVDDADQGVEEVVRGDDLLSSTPSQAHLADLLAIARPTWAHVPLVLGADNQRLAKRHGAVTLSDLGARGHDADAVRSLLAASVGLVEPGEPVTTRQLLDRFDPARLPRTPWTWPEPPASA
jgi:glutamyl-tRNA synthetase